MKARSKKASGGEANFGKAVEVDDPKPKNRGASSKVSSEAMAKKNGGRAARKSGGNVKNMGDVKGDRDNCAGRSPRKSGGRTGSNFSPFSSARAGEAPKGHKTTSID